MILWTLFTESSAPPRRPLTNQILDSPGSTPETTNAKLTASFEEEEDSEPSPRTEEQKPKLIGVTLRAHGGKQIASPYSVHPKQLVMSYSFGWLQI